MSSVAQPIDLTGDDEWAGQEREAKRPRTGTLSSQETATNGQWYPPPVSYSGLQNTAIDLTGTPSPPATVSGSTPVPTTPKQDTGRTVMCIGELSVTALILYPIRYLAPSNTTSDATPATATIPATCLVKLRYDSAKKRIGQTIGAPSDDYTVNISSLSTPTSPGEDFGVVDQKAANALAPIMERGLIRIEARVFKGSENVRFIIFSCSR